MNAAFRCEHCGGLLRAQGRADARFRCPNCGGMVEVPAALAAMPRPRLEKDLQAVGAASAHGTGDYCTASASRLATIERLMPFALSLCFHLGLVAVTLFLGTMLIERKQPPIEVPLVASGVMLDDSRQPMAPPEKNRSQEPGRAAGLSPGKAGAPQGRFLLIPERRMGDPLGGGDGREAGKADRIRVIGLPLGRGGDPNGSPGATGRGPFWGPGAGGFYGINWRWGRPDGGGDGEGGGLAQHVVFVVDRSGSMVESFDAVRDEMFRSIGLLDPQVQDFHVILFSDGPPLEPADRRLVPPTREYIGTVTRFLAGTSPRGPTDPLPALSRAFEVLDKVRGTKVIYLLTDSQFPDNEKVLQFLRRRNAGKEARVNAVLYGERTKEAEETMRTIARENGGAFRHVRPE